MSGYPTYHPSGVQAHFKILPRGDAPQGRRDSGSMFDTWASKRNVRAELVILQNEPSAGPGDQPLT